MASLDHGQEFVGHAALPSLWVYSNLFVFDNLAGLGEHAGRVGPVQGGRNFHLLAKLAG